MVLGHNINEGQRTKDIQITQDITFETMLLSEDTLNGLKGSGFYKPSPIQLHGIPLGKCGFDLLLEAKSGTGKTAVFTVIALENLDLGKGLQVVVLAPTREIAAQICDVLRQIGQKFEGLCVEVVMGGLSIQEDINKFKNNNVHIVVGSPGRLKHLIHEKHIDLKSVRLFILDEADKLMEKSFLADIKYIHSALPKQKQVIMSSATYPESCKEIINQFVHDAQHICPNSNCILLGVAQKVTYVKYNSNIVRQTENRFIELLKILSKKQFKQCLIFCNYQARVGELHKMLTREKWPVEQLFGQQDQIDRLDALKTLQQYKCRILVSTDLAARGIDASNVDLVINFEPPYDWPTYLHRIGRAGRFGSYGMAVTILSEGVETNKFMNLLQSLNTSVCLLALWPEDNAEDDNTANTDNKQLKRSIGKDTIEHDDVENYFEKFWTIICNNEEVVKPHLKAESFDELMNSYKNNNQHEIASFSELLTSFQSSHSFDHNESDSYLYKNVELPDISNMDLNLKNLNKSLQFIKNHIHERMEKNYNILDREGVNDHNVSHSSKLSDDDMKSKYTAEVLNIKHDINDNKINSFCADCKNNNLTVGINDKTSPKLKEENAELLKLGLPLCFSSFNKKQNNKKCSVSSQNQIQYSEKKLRHSNESKENMNKNPISYFNRQSNKPNLKKKLLLNQDTNVKNRFPNEIECGSQASSSCIHNHAPNSKYANWYSKLKLQVKQIEQMIYIEELNKFN
ncbi:unnamed protein product, partial [Brenthis ino]